MGMKRFTSKMLFSRAVYASTCCRNAQKSLGNQAFLISPLFWKGERPNRSPGRWGYSAAPSGAASGAVGPFAQRKKHQIPVANTAQPPSAPPGVFPVPAEGAAQGCAGGRRHLAAGAKGPGLPNGKPGPGAKGPGPGFQGATRPRRPPGPLGFCQPQRDRDVLWNVT